MSIESIFPFSELPSDLRSRILDDGTGLDKARSICKSFNQEIKEVQKEKIGALESKAHAILERLAQSLEGNCQRLAKKYLQLLSDPKSRKEMKKFLQTKELRTIADSSTFGQEEPLGLWKNEKLLTDEQKFSARNLLRTMFVTQKMYAIRVLGKELPSEDNRYDLEQDDDESIAKKYENFEKVIKEKNQSQEVISSREVVAARKAHTIAMVVCIAVAVFFLIVTLACLAMPVVSPFLAAAGSISMAGCLALTFAPLGASIVSGFLGLFSAPGIHLCDHLSEKIFSRIILKENNLWNSRSF